MSTAPTTEELTEALNWLVDQPDVLELKQDVATLVNTKFGRFTGPHYPLNALVEYARSKGGVEWLGLLWAIVDQAISPPEEPQAEAGAASRQAIPRRRTPEAKEEYNRRQNTYMNAKRARERKAVMLDKQIKGLSQPLTGKARVQRLKEIAAVWNQRKNALLETIQGIKERNEMTSDFWQEIEAQLDAGLAGNQQAARHVLGLD